MAYDDAETDTSDSLVTEGRDAFKDCEEAWSENRRTYLDDLKFARLGEQWNTKVMADREAENRPALTLNLLPAFLRQVVNDARQNKPQIKVHPVDDQADPDTAEIFNGLIRNIWVSSKGDVATDTAIDCATSGGFGFIGVNLEYASDDTFLQDIVIKPKPNPLSVYGDPNYSAADSADWNVAFEVEELTQKQFERRWKGADKVDWRTSDYSKQDDWCYDKKVRVAAWWSREEERKKLLAVVIPAFSMAPGVNPPIPMPVDPVQGGVMPVLESVYKDHKAFFDSIGATVEGQSRDVLSHKVTQRIMSGVEVLDTIDWAGRFIPIIPVYGDVVNVEGKVYLRSLIRDAKDSQQQCNFWETTATEVVGNAPKAPFIGPESAFQGIDANKWENANRVAYPYISYPDKDANQQPIVPPQRQAPAFPATAEMQMAINAYERIKAITGLHDASLGARSNETSGRAILARQREGDTSTFHFTDNLTRGINHLGNVLIDLIPHVYGVDRVARVLGEDGAPQTVKLGKVPPEQEAALKAQAEAQEGQAEAAKIARIYDLTVGKYDLVVAPGPSYTTKREEAASQMIELIRAYPQAAPLIGDLLAKNLDWPGAEEIAKRLQAMLPPAVKGENPEMAAAQQQLQQLQAALQEMQQKLVQAEQDKTIEVAKVQNDAADKQAQRELDAEKLKVDQYKAETDRMKALAPKGVGLPPGSEQAIAAMVLQTIGQLLDSPDLIQDGEAMMSELPPLVEEQLAEPQEEPGFEKQPQEPTVGPAEAPEL